MFHANDEEDLMETESEERKTLAIPPLGGAAVIPPTPDGGAVTSPLALLLFRVVIDPIVFWNHVFLVASKSRCVDTS